MNRDNTLRSREISSTPSLWDRVNKWISECEFEQDENKVDVTPEAEISSQKEQDRISLMSIAKITVNSLNFLNSMHELNVVEECDLYSASLTIVTTPATNSPESSLLKSCIVDQIIHFVGSEPEQ